ncbi:YlbF family regulator [Alkalicoccus halolimnae]|uniref:YlbF family regulator n=1 Tax=Alkalicoccus halolimnae TaxID=1667239 RepID=A0A5C7FD90_9BACI|nr:YlbF family regulator [Alkalicoccus halolimnae]TXF87448.1 YlbF family regulator [Alkalicoccus halolimnae]
MMTMTDLSLVHEAQDLSDLITSSQVFQSYIHVKRRVQDDRECQQKLLYFQELKEKYEEVQRFGKYHPDFRSITAEVREYKRQLDTDPLLAEFKQTEKELHELLSEISLLLANQVSPNIKVPTGNPFFDAQQSSCSGGCGSGGSCGCG